MKGPFPEVWHGEGKPQGTTRAPGQRAVCRAGQPAVVLRGEELRNEDPDLLPLSSAGPPVVRTQSQRVTEPVEGICRCH